LEDNFKRNYFNYKHLVQFDETQTQSFKGTEDHMKKITGGGTDEAERGMYSQDILKTRYKSHITITTNKLPEFELTDIALFGRISIIELKNEFSYLETEINHKNIFPINDNIQAELMEDIQGIENLIYESIIEYNEMRTRGENFINKKGIEYVRAFYFGNDHLINFLKTYCRFTKETAIETTTAQEIYNNYLEYLKDNDIDLIANETDTKRDIGTKLNRLYDNIVRDKNQRPIQYKNIKCIYSTGTEIAYKINPDLEDYYIKEEFYNKIFNFIKKGYNTFELLKQQEKSHNDILTAITYLKHNGYIEEYKKLKNNE